MRILHLISDLTPAGAEIMLANVVAATRRVCDHVVISLTTKGQVAAGLEATGVKVYALNIRGALSLPAAIRSLQKIKNEVQPDIVHTWMIHANLVGVLAHCVGRPTPLIWGVRNGILGNGEGKLLTRGLVRLCGALSRLPDEIVFNSRRALVGHVSLGYCRSRMTYIPNGFRSDVVTRDDAKGAQLRAMLKVPHDATVVAHVARYHPVKGHELFIRSAAKVLSAKPDTYILLCGRGVEEGNPSIAKLIAASGLVEKARLLGERRDVLSVYSAADVLVSSSYSEGFPNTVAEAMLCGLPCIVTDAGESGEVIGDTGWRVPVGNASALVRAMLDAISSGREELGRKGRVARGRIEKLFDLATVSKAYMSIYHLVLSRRRPGKGA